MTPVVRCKRCHGKLLKIMETILTQLHLAWTKRTTSGRTHSFKYWLGVPNPNDIHSWSLLVVDHANRAPYGTNHAIRHAPRATRIAARLRAVLQEEPRQLLVPHERGASQGREAWRRTGQHMLQLNRNWTCYNVEASRVGGGLMTSQRF